MDVPPVPEKIARSIGAIRFGKNVIGTAFVISETEALTAAHVFFENESSGGDPNRFIWGEKGLDIEQVRVTVEFPEQAATFRIKLEAIDKVNDIAVVTRASEEGETAPLPPALIPGRASLLAALGVPVRWHTQGAPPAINERGHPLSGSIASWVGTWGHVGARILHLNVKPHDGDDGLLVLGGMSGSPIVVDGKAIAVLRGFPPNVKDTIYATPLEATLGLPAVAAAFERANWTLDDEYLRIHRLQDEWLDHPRPEGTVTSDALKGVVYMAPAFYRANSDERVAFDDLLHLQSVKSPGILISGEAGLGKTTLLLKMARRLIREPGSFFERAHVTPLVTRAPDLIGAGNVYEALFRGATVKSSLDDVRRLRKFLDAGDRPWLFIIDGLDRALGSVESAVALSSFFNDLDNLCKDRGHRWIAVCLPANRQAIRFPPETEELRLLPWSRSNAREFLSRSYGSEGETMFDRLSRMPNGIVLDNPFLLSTAARTAFVTKGRTIPATAMDALSGFLGDIVTRAEELVRASESRVLQAVAEKPGVWGFACAVAESSVESDSPINPVAEMLGRLGSVTYSESRSVAAKFVKGPLRICGLLTVSDDDRVFWAHDLFRDFLAGAAILDRYKDKDSDEADRKRLLKRGLEPLWRQATALMLVQLSRGQSVIAELAVLDNEDASGLPTIVEFLALGGKLEPAYVEELMSGLRDWVQREKHDGDSCHALFADVFGGFNPLDALLSLASLETAVAALKALQSDLFLPERWRKIIDARLSASELDNP